VTLLNRLPKADAFSKPRNATEMSLFIAQNFMTSVYNFAQVQAHIISISVMDGGIGFATATTNIEGAACTQVTYARSQAGPTAVRLDSLVHDTGFTAPQQIVAFGVPSNTIMPNGINVSAVAGKAFNVGEPGSPLATHIALIYDTGDCSGSGYWVDKEGGGTTSFPPNVILYHELAHCFHFVTGVATSEPLAETDENDMRDVNGIPHRNTASHNGGCGGGATSCCIVASISTGSPYSQEIQRFRQIRDSVLRQSIVGDDFFNEFFYRYYAFSPEVRRLLGHHPHLKPLVRERFVVPLLAGADLLIHYKEGKGSGLAEFLREQACREELGLITSDSCLKEIREYTTAALSLGVQIPDEFVDRIEQRYRGFRKLLEHIHVETVRDEYISWALVRVVDLWLNSICLVRSQMADAEIEKRVSEGITTWISEMPISDIWRELSRLETLSELQSLEQFMIDTISKRAFAKRLINKHPQYRETVDAWMQGHEG